jgi:hypothetical protein
MTSLPALTFGHEPPISMDEFYKDAKSQLSERHFRKLDGVDIQNMVAKKGVKRSVANFVSDVKHDLIEVRNAKLQNRQAKFERMPKQVLAGNPLLREEKLMKWQWEELDTIEAGKTFTLTEVMVYKLKLQILLRLHSFDKNKGAEVLASVVNPSKNMKE